MVARRSVRNTPKPPQAVKEKQAAAKLAAGKDRRTFPHESTKHYPFPSKHPPQTRHLSYHIRQRRSSLPEKTEGLSSTKAQSTTHSPSRHKLPNQAFTLNNSPIIINQSFSKRSEKMTGGQPDAYLYTLPCQPTPHNAELVNNIMWLSITPSRREAEAENSE